MGAFFTNVQVFTKGLTSEEARAAVIEALGQTVRAEGFVEAAPGERIDRTILVAPAGPGPWLAVYDEATEGQDLETLAALTQALSTAIGSAALGILVSDSDDLDLLLWRSGAEADHYHLHVLSGAPPHMAGKPEDWTDLMAPGASVVDLRTLFAQRPVLVEDVLWPLAERLALDPERCGTGYRYLEQEVNTSAFARLAFRSVQPPAYTADATGLPRLQLASWMAQPLRQTVGRPLEFVSIHVQNMGGAGRGVRIVVWGAALERGLVGLTGVRLIHRSHGAREATTSTEVALEEARGSGGVLMRHAMVPEFHISPGIADPSFMLRLRRGQSTHQGLNRMFDAQFGAFIDGNAVAPGQGDLNLGLAPLENVAHGQAAVRLQLDVIESKPG